MKKNSLKLIQIERTHLPILFNWRNESSFINNCTGRNKINDIEKFDKELKSDFQKDRHLQYLILLKERPIGTIYSYSFNDIDKTLFISVYIEPEFANYSYGIRAFTMFSKYLFNEFKIYKIYFDIYEYNIKMITVLEKCGFALEGVFKNQHFFQDQRYDVSRYAFYKDNMLFWSNKFKIK